MTGDAQPGGVGGFLQKGLFYWGEWRSVPLFSEFVVELWPPRAPTPRSTRRGAARTSTSDYKPLRCGAHRYNRTDPEIPPALEYSSVTVRGTCPMLGGVLLLACFTRPPRRRRPRWPRSACLLISWIQEHICSVSLAQDVTHQLACCSPPLATQPARAG